MKDKRYWYEGKVQTWDDIMKHRNISSPSGQIAVFNQLKVKGHIREYDGSTPVKQTSKPTPIKREKNVDSPIKDPGVEQVKELSKKKFLYEGKIHTWEDIFKYRNVKSPTSQLAVFNQLKEKGIVREYERSTPVIQNTTAAPIKKKQSMESDNKDPGVEQVTKLSKKKFVYEEKVQTWDDIMKHRNISSPSGQIAVFNQLKEKGRIREYDGSTPVKPKEETVHKTNSDYFIKQHLKNKRFWYKGKICKFEAIMKKEGIQTVSDYEKQHHYDQLMKNGIIREATAKEMNSHIDAQNKSNAAKSKAKKYTKPIPKTHTLNQSKQPISNFYLAKNKAFWYQGKICKLDEIMRLEGFQTVSDHQKQLHYKRLMESGKISEATIKEINIYIEEKNKKNVGNLNHIKQTNPSGQTQNSLNQQNNRTSPDKQSSSGTVQLNPPTTHQEYIGSEIGGVIGDVIGHIAGMPIKYAGELIDSEFLRNIGEGVIKSSHYSGEIVGGITGGTLNTVKGIVTGDDLSIEQGINEIGNAAKKGGKGIVHTVESTVISGANIIEGAVSGDSDQLKQGVKGIATTAAVGTFAWGLIDFSLDEHGAITEQGITPNAEKSQFIDPHYVQSYETAEGKVVEGYWRDGDGNTNDDRTLEQGGGYERSTSNKG